MPSQAELRKQITNRIVAALEQDLLPWRKPWVSSKNSGRPANVVSQKLYSGVNPILLELHAQEHGFKSKWWGTYAQWQQLGCQVMRRPSDVEQGKWGCQIVFFKPVSKTVIDPVSGEEEREDFRVLKSYTVFCADQVAGPNAHKYQVEESGDADATHIDFGPAERFIDATGAEIRYGGDHAFYAKPCPEGSWPNHKYGDCIQVPVRESFLQDWSGGYYETIFHELAHWSEVRLGWEDCYEMNELVAEIACSYLTTELGVPQGEPLENHAAYVQHWLTKMKGDVNFVFRAATQASKVTDYLLSFVPAEEEAIPF